MDLNIVDPILIHSKIQNLPESLVLTDALLLAKDLLHQERGIKFGDGKNSGLREHAFSQKHRCWLRQLLYLEEIVLLSIIENLSGFISESWIRTFHLK